MEYGLTFKPLSKNLPWSISRFDYQLLFWKIGLHSTPQKIILGADLSMVEIKPSLRGFSCILIWSFVLGKHFLVITATEARSPTINVQQTQKTQKPFGNCSQVM